MSYCTYMLAYYHNKKLKIIFFIYIFYLYNKVMQQTNRSQNIDKNYHLELNSCKNKHVK